MMDSLFQTGLSNACISLALALIATAVGALTKRARVAHLLWLLVFVKLITPPVVTIPVGICVILTAELVFCICCPPGPLDRKVSILRSSGFIETSASLSTSGMTSTRANEV